MPIQQDASQYQLQQLQQEIAALRFDVSRLRRGGNFILVSTTLQGTAPATAGNYGVFFTAPYAVEVIEAWETHGTAGSSTPTLTIEKLTSSQALDSGVQAISSAWSLNGTANDPIRIKASGVVTNRSLSPGDRLALKDAGTLTAIAHVCVTVLLRVLNFTLSRSDNPA